MKHLHKSVVELLTKSIDDRVEYIQQKHWIGYPDANKAIDKMEDLLNHPQTHRMPNMLIKSETNNGKSFILDRFLKRHPPYEDQTDRRIKTPIISLEVPPDPSPDSIYALVLDYLKIAYRDSYAKDVKRMKALNAIKYHEVKMLLIDELHVLMNTTRLKKSQLLDTLKYLSNQCCIPIVGAGTAEAHVAILSDSQLANRFEPFLLPQWKLNDNFRRLLSSFEKILPLKKPSNLPEKELTIEIYSMSGGWIGEVDTLLKRAAIYALRKGDERITKETLRRIDWLSPEERRRVAGL